MARRENCVSMGVLADNGALKLVSGNSIPLMVVKCGVYFDEALLGLSYTATLPHGLTQLKNELLAPFKIVVTNRWEIR